MAICITNLRKTNIKKGDYNTMAFFQITMSIAMQSNLYEKENALT